MLFYKWTMVFRSVRVIFLVYRIFNTGKDEVTRQIFTIMVFLTALIILIAGSVEVFDKKKREEYYNAAIDACAADHIPKH